MAEISFELPDNIAIILAISRGWSFEIEDTSKDPDEEGVYPLMLNPVTYTQYIEAFAADFITGVVLEEGTKRVLINFESTYKTIEAQVKSGAFDNLILAGDVAGIQSAILQGLSSQ